MERINVYCRGICCGEASVLREGARAEISVVMDDPGDGLYRAVLMGAEGSMTLGVMEPESGKLVLRRRPYGRDLTRLGDLRRVESRCSFPFRKKAAWQRTEQPAELVEDDFLRHRLSGVPHAWWRRGQRGLVLALPLGTDGAFPLETMFCLARVEWVEEERCAVFEFGDRDAPVMGGID